MSLTPTVVVKLTPTNMGPREAGAIDRGRRLRKVADRQYGLLTRPQLLDLGVGRGAIDWWLRSGRLRGVHRGVYALGHVPLGRHGRLLAAVLAHGEEAVLSHLSAASLWGIARARGRVDVTSRRGRAGRSSIRLHVGRLEPDEATVRDRVPITTVPRTLLDLSQVVDARRLRTAWEEADRLGLLRLASVEGLCHRHTDRNGVRAIRGLLREAAWAPASRSPLEDRLLAVCREHGLPAPRTNVEILGREVDAFWPDARLIVEADGFDFHRHRTAFEDDRARDAAMLAAGYRVVRVTHRRLERESAAVAGQLRALLAPKGRAPA